LGGGLHAFLAAAWNWAALARPTTGGGFRSEKLVRVGKMGWGEAVRVRDCR
jgi:hypothetical protein